MKKYITLLSIAFAFIANAQPTFIKDSLDNYISEGIKDWQIPGLAITIVKDGKVVVMKGYGVKNIQTNEPVDENTLFMIASNSKLFTGTALAQLDYNKKLSLDDRITKYFPNFKLYDAAATKLVTIKDMLSHRLGTKTFQGDFTFWNSALSRSEVMNKMRYLKPSNDFRSSYGYCNSCFLTAGEVIQKVTNKSWEQYIIDSIVLPLKMSNTKTLTFGMDKLANIALPYTTAYTNTVTQIPFDQIDNMAPATSLVSCVKDISHWLLMQLDSGRYDGKQILPWQVVQKTRDMVNPISSRKKGNTHFNGYGLGVFISDYKCNQIYNHTGGADGFVTNTCFVPELNLGISILTNNDNQSFFELLRWQILDAYMDEPYKNRSKQRIAAHNKELNEQVEEINTWKNRVVKAPQIVWEKYLGTYKNQLYGTITITQKENNLQIKFNGHKNLTATMQYMDNDEWLMTFNPIQYGVFKTKFVLVNGQPKSIDIKVNDFIEFDAYRFEKVK